jgi:multicomponent Na+:H+ antiporter subunit D
VILLLPVLIPLTAAGLMILLGRWPHLHRGLSVAGAAGQLAACLWLAAAVFTEGPQTVQVGGWTAPYGITFVADTLSAMMALATGLLGFLGVWAAVKTVDQEVQKLYFHPVLMALLAGVAGSFLTGDLFNLFVWFEVTLMSSFVLMSLGKGPKQIPAALRYMALNLIGSVFFLSACGLIYGAAGTLNMAHLALRIGEIHPGLREALAVLLLCAFLIKSAAFPLFGWLPSSYPSIPASVAAVMAGLLTKVGVYAIFRLFTLIFSSQTGIVDWVLGFAALASMAVGVIGAYGQDDYRRILTFHIISQIGYMLAGIALGGPAALAGGVFMLVHNMAAKTGLFYLAGAAEEALGPRALSEMGGLREAQPHLARAFLICGFGLAGIPPLSGFFAKLSILGAAVNLQDWLFVVTMLAVSLVTLLSMVKIWMEAYVKPLPEARHHGEPPSEERETQPLSTGRLWAGPAWTLAGVVMLMGIFAGPLQDTCMKVGRELSDPSGYITAVLGGDPPR